MFIAVAKKVLRQCTECPSLYHCFAEHLTRLRKTLRVRGILFENRWCLRNSSLVQVFGIADLTNEAASRRIRNFGTQFTL
jgi:hypothetical protein